MYSYIYSISQHLHFSMIRKIIKETKDYNSFLYDVFTSSIFVLNNQNLILSCPIKPFHAPIYTYI